MILWDPDIFDEGYHTMKVSTLATLESKVVLVISVCAPLFV